MSLEISLVMKILKDEQHIFLKACKFTIFEILRHFVKYHYSIIYTYYGFMLSLHIKFYGNVKQTNFVNNVIYVY